MENIDPVSGCCKLHLGYQAAPALEGGYSGWCWAVIGKCTRRYSVAQLPDSRHRTLKAYLIKSSPKVDKKIDLEDWKGFPALTNRSGVQCSGEYKKLLDYKIFL